MRYSPYVRPMMLDGVRCVVEPALQEIESRAYRFLLDFATDNELVVIDPTAPASEDFCPVPGGALDALLPQSAIAKKENRRFMSLQRRERNRR